MGRRPVGGRPEEDNIELLLSRMRAALLEFAPPKCEIRTTVVDPEVDIIGATLEFMGRGYWRAIGNYIEGLVPLLDDIPDQRRRLKALNSIYLLIYFVSGVSLNCMKSPMEELRAEFRMARARSPLTRRVEQRRERLRPLVVEMTSRFPSEGAAKIAARLRKRKGFDAQFGTSRRTTEADVAALLTTAEAE